MADEHLAAAIHALRRYEQAQSRLLEDARRDLECDERYFKSLRDMRSSRDAEALITNSEPSLALMILRSLNPLEPCGWRRACSRFAWVTWLVPFVILLADWLGRALS